MTVFFKSPQQTDRIEEEYSPTGRRYENVIVVRVRNLNTTSECLMYSDCY